MGLISTATQLAVLGGGVASLSGIVMAARHALRRRQDRGQLRRRLGQVRHLCYVCDPLLLPHRAAVPRAGR